MSVAIALLGRCECSHLPEEHLDGRCQEEGVGQMQGLRCECLRFRIYPPNYLDDLVMRVNAEFAEDGVGLSVDRGRVLRRLQKDVEFRSRVEDKVLVHQELVMYGWPARGVGVLDRLDLGKVLGRVRPDTQGAVRGVMSPTRGITDEC